MPAPPAMKFKIQFFTTWGTDWQSTPKTLIPINYEHFFQISAHPRLSPIVMASQSPNMNYDFSEMVLILNKGEGFVKLNLDNLPAIGTVLALDWGK